MFGATMEKERGGIIGEGGRSWWLSGGGGSMVCDVVPAGDGG